MHKHCFTFLFNFLFLRYSTEGVEAYWAEIQGIWARYWTFVNTRKLLVWLLWFWYEMKCDNRCDAPSVIAIHFAPSSSDTDLSQVDSSPCHSVDSPIISPQNRFGKRQLIFRRHCCRIYQSKCLQRKSSVRKNGSFSYSFRKFSQKLYLSSMFYINLFFMITTNPSKHMGWFR